MKWLKINTGLLLAIVLSWAPLSQADTQFRVIVDASGSMLISDPDKLTSEALRLISDLAPEEKATLGIWLFGEAPRVLLPEAAINKETKTKLASYVSSYVTQDVKTDLEAIIDLLLQTPDEGGLAPGFERHWILVTDGMVDISLDESINMASRDRILNDFTQKLEAKGVHLHTISMTGYTDKELLESLSLRTSATHTEVAIPEDLLDTFDRIFSQVDPAETLPFSGNKFTVDQSIDELTLMVFHEPNNQPQVVKPDASILPLITQNNVSIAAADHYTLVTIADPEIGDWFVNNIDLERSSVRIITDLNAKATKVPPIVFVNEPIFSTVGLFQNDKLIKDESVLKVLSVNQTLARLNGENKQMIFSKEIEQEGGQFKHRIDQTSEPGNYELTTQLDGQSFSRQLGQYFAVYPAIIFDGSEAGDNLVSFSAKPANLKLNVLRSKVALEFTYENGEINTEEMPVIGQGYWDKVVPVSPDSTIKVRAHLIGFTQAGVRFEYWTPVWTVLREGTSAPLVQFGDSLPPSIVLSKTPVVDRSVAPLFIPPAVIEVESDEAAVGSTIENTDDADPSSTDKMVDEVEDLSADEWIMYGVLNIGGVLILVAGFLLYRRFTNKKSSEE